MRIPLHICFFLLVGVIATNSCGNGPIETKNIKVVKDTSAVETKKGLRYGVLLATVDKTPFSDSKGILGDQMVICSYKGRVHATDTAGNGDHLLFDLKAEFMIDKIFVLDMDKKYFVTWQETDHEGVKSYFACYSEGTDKPLWKIAKEVMNPTQPVVDGSSAYVSTLGMVGKLNLSDGKFAWQYDSLFNQHNGAFKELEPALVYDKEVIFYDKPIQGKRAKSDSLYLDPATGSKIR